MKRIFFMEDVREWTVRRLIDEIEKLRKENEEEFVLYVSSPGGDTMAGRSFYQYVSVERIKMKTIALARVYSAALFLFLAGEERVANSRSMFLIHPPDYPNLFKRISCELLYPVLWPRMNRESRRLNRATLSAVKELLETRTGLSQEEIGEALSEGFTLDASQALKKGIVHRIEDLGA